jgi:hypothetical protein
LEQADINQLNEWLEKFPEPKKKPLPRAASNSPVEPALEHLQEIGFITGFEHIGKGLGRHAYELYEPQRKTPLIAKIRHSGPDKKDPSKYHFEIGRHEMEWYWESQKKARPRPEAMLFVPSSVDGGFSTDSNTPPVVFFKFKDWCGIPRLSWTAFRKRVKNPDGVMPVHLIQNEDGRSWFLRVPAASGSGGKKNDILIPLKIGRNGLARLAR